MDSTESGPRLPVRTYTTVRRGRFLDGWIEALLGAAVVLGFFGAAGGITAGAVMLTNSGFGLIPFFVCLAFAVPIFDRANTWIRRMALQPYVNRGTVVVGEDGLFLTGLFLRKYASFADVFQVTVDRGKRRVRIGLRSGRTIQFRVPEPERVRDEILFLLARYRQASPSHGLRAFRDGLKDLPGWRARVQKLTSGGYRDEACTPDVLVRIAEDPLAEAEQRLGAARALSNAPEPLRVRVRAAADATAKPAPGHAMSQAVDGEADEGLLMRVLKQTR